MRRILPYVTVLCRKKPRCSGLTEEQEIELQNVLQIIPEPSENPGKTELTERKIDISSHTPIRQRCYAVSPKVQEAIHAEADKMLAAGIIELSYSEWSNSIVMIKNRTVNIAFV